MASFATSCIAENLRSEKFIAITNGIDNVPCPPPQRDKSAVTCFIRVPCMGTGGLRPLLQAILKLISVSNIDPTILRVSFAGSVDQAVLEEAKTEISELQQSGMIQIYALLPYQQAQALLSSADVLLLIQGDNRDAVPVKFYEYVVARKPILALAKPGALSRLIEDTAVGLSSDPDDADAIETDLVRCIESAPRTPADYDELTQRIPFPTLTAQLVEVMRQLDFPNRKPKDCLPHGHRYENLGGLRYYAPNPPRFPHCPSHHKANLLTLPNLFFAGSHMDGSVWACHGKK